MDSQLFSAKMMPPRSPLNHRSRMDPKKTWQFLENLPCTIIESDKKSPLKPRIRDFPAMFDHRVFLTFPYFHYHFWVRSQWGLFWHARIHRLWLVVGKIHLVIDVNNPSTSFLRIVSICLHMVVSIIVMLGTPYACMYIYIYSIPYDWQLYHYLNIWPVSYGIYIYMGDSAGIYYYISILCISWLNLGE